MHSKRAQLTFNEINDLLFFFPKGITFFDLETTGLSTTIDQIIEVAFIKIKASGEVVILEKLINPEITIPAHTTAIHHITDDMVKNSENLLSLADEISAFISDTPLMAHNAKFDASFLFMNFLKINKKLPPTDIYCSCQLAKKFVTELKHHKLQSLIAHFKLSEKLFLSPVQNHRAFEDTLFTLHATMIILKNNREIKPAQFYLYNLSQFCSENIKDLPDHLLPLKKLTQNNHTIYLRYKRGQNRNNLRAVKLNSLLETPEGTMLNAYCISSRLHKTYKIQYISEIVLPTAQQLQEILQTKPII